MLSIDPGIKGIFCALVKDGKEANPAPKGPTSHQLREEWSYHLSFALKDEKAEDGVRTVAAWVVSGGSGREKDLLG